MILITPTVRLSTWLVIGLFAFGSITLYLSPYRDLTMTIGSLIFLLLFLIMLWLVDYSHLTIRKEDSFLIFKGYFNLRNVKLAVGDIKGFEKCEKLDQINGSYTQYQIVMKNEERVFIPKLGYEDNYDEIIDLCESELHFLGYEKIKYGEILKKVMPVVYLLSGILAGLVGLMKVLNW